MAGEPAIGLAGYRPALTGSPLWISVAAWTPVAGEDRVIPPPSGIPACRGNVSDTSHKRPFGILLGA
jgi:hypothetical protein